MNNRVIFYSIKLFFLLLLNDTYILTSKSYYQLEIFLLLVISYFIYIDYF